MTPTILIAKSQETINQWLDKQLTEFRLDREIRPEKKSLSIEQVKFLTKHFHLSSGTSEKLLYVIHQADTLTLPAQNSLLKTLEETPENRLIILTVTNPNQLLPTILSRCLIINLTSNEQTQTIPNLNPALSEWSGEEDRIIQLTDTILKSDPLEYFNQAFLLIHSSMKRNPSANRLKILRHLSILLDDLKTNINPKLSIDQFFLKIKEFLKST